MSNIVEPDNENTAVPTERPPRTWPVWVGATAFVTVLFVAFWFVAPLFAPAEKMEKLGSAGDVAAILGTLFSGFAFAGVIVALYLQSRQIRSTDADVRRQTSILQQQVSALKGQTTALLKQVDTMLRPYIAIWVSKDVRGEFQLHIANKGRSAASNLRLTMDKDFRQGGMDDRSGIDFNLRNHYLFQNVQPTFPPEMVVTFWMGGGIYLASEHAEKHGMPRQFSIEAEYEFGGQLIKELFVIDVRQLDVKLLGADPVYERLVSVADNIEKMREGIDAIVKYRR